MWGTNVWGTGLWGTDGQQFVQPATDLTIYINGENVTGFCRPETYRREGGLNRRTVASFELVDRTNSYRPPDGATVIVFKNGTRNFGGTIESAEENMIQSSADARVISINAVDFNQILDKRVVVRNFETPTLAGDIVKTIITEFLAEEGIFAGTVQDGVVVDRALFNYDTASEALDQLAQLVGMSWHVDFFKGLNFMERTAMLSSVQITDADQAFRQLVRSSSRDDYANFVYLRGGTSLSDPQNQSFTGDSENQTFNVGLPIDQKPTVLLNSVAQTVGIQGVDDETAFQWYFSKGKTEITQRLTDTPISSADTLDVTYIGQFPLIVAGQLPAEIDERALVEGNSGKYEFVEDNPDIDDRQLAVDTVDALLRRFGKIPKRVTFQKDDKDFKPGELVTFSLTEEDIAGDFMVTDVTFEEKDLQGRSIYTITVTSGELVGNWVEWFRRLKKQGKRFAIRENEVLEILRFKEEAVNAADSIDFVTALDDGDNDPYTGLITDSETDEVEFAHFVGSTNVGKDQP